MTSRRRRPQYRPVTIGYRASRWQAGLPRQTGLTGVHLRSVLRFASGFHPTRPHGKDLGCAMPASTSCSCLRLLVASNWPHKGLSPSIIHPCPTHLPSSRCARLGQAHTGDLQKRRYTNLRACHSWQAPFYRCRHYSKTAGGRRRRGAASNGGRCRGPPWHRGLGRSGRRGSGRGSF